MKRHNPYNNMHSLKETGQLLPASRNNSDNNPVSHPTGAKLPRSVFWTMIFGVLLTVGCRIPTYVEKDPSADLNQYKTYAWIDDKDSKRKSDKPYKDFQETHLIRLVEENLQKSGFVRARSNPDVLIDYDIMIENEVREQSDPVYSRPFIRYYYNPYTGRINRLFYPSRYMGQTSYTVPYKSGTITVNIVDNRSKKLVWQGWAETEVTKRQIDREDMSKAVKSIFRKLDITRK